MQGRYLSPEPLLRSPEYVRRMAQAGTSVPAYSYAASNPLRFVDPTGLDVLILYGNPEYVGVTPFSRSSYEAALEATFGPMVGEHDPSRVFSASAEDGFLPGSLATQPSGGRWDHVVYVGHGMEQGLWLDFAKGKAAFSTEFARWFGGRGPKQVSIHGCNAGGRDSAFRQGLRQLLPFTRINGIDGALAITPWPTSLSGSFGGFREIVPQLPTTYGPSWAESNGWQRW